MVRVRSRRIGNNTYYYLEHTARVQGSVIKEEVYLGKKIPENVEELKEKLLTKIHNDKWYQILDRIRDNYAGEARLMPPSYRKKEEEIFAVNFTYHTQRIEGSTLSLRETADLLERGTTPKGRPVGDVKEAEAHRKLFYEILRHKKDLSLNDVLWWHRELFRETKPDIAGKIRKTRVGISGSKFAPPLPVEVYPMLQDFFDWYKGNNDKIHPVELAALVHLKFVTIHPFADGNGRLSRLMMNFVLNMKGYPMLNISYEGRASYYNALEMAHAGKRDHVCTRWFNRYSLKSYKAYL